jgi:membrane protein YdbS with pleckstrin-like domain
MQAIITDFLTHTLFTMLWSWFSQFWMWIGGVAVAILAWMFSPAIRTYTIAILAAMALLFSAFIYGYTYHTTQVIHEVQTQYQTQVVTHQCSEFSPYLVKGPSADKFLAVLKRHNLCI